MKTSESKLKTKSIDRSPIISKRRSVISVITNMLFLPESRFANFNATRRKIDHTESITSTSLRKFVHRPRPGAISSIDLAGRNL